MPEDEVLEVPGQRRWARLVVFAAVGLLMAAVLGSLANGFIQERDRTRLGQELDGISAREVAGLEQELDVERGCTAGGALCFFISWVGITLVFARVFKRPPKEAERTITGSVRR